MTDIIEGIRFSTEKNERSTWSMLHIPALNQCYTYLQLIRSQRTKVSDIQHLNSSFKTFMLGNQSNHQIFLVNNSSTITCNLHSVEYHNYVLLVVPVSCSHNARHSFSNGYFETDFRISFIQGAGEWAILVNFSRSVQARPKSFGFS